MDSRELYQQVILDHNRSPRNFKRLEDSTHTAVGHNPLCGDKIVVDIHVEDGVIVDVGFQGAGCAISNASASLMTDSIKGKTVEEAETMFDSFHDLVTSDGKETDRKTLGRLAAFAGVSEFPARVKCASLSWHTLRAALKHKKETVVTE